MLTRYISNELTDQRGSKRDATNHVVSQSSSGFYPKLLPSSGQYLVDLNRWVERLESFAKTAVLEDSCKVFGRPRFAIILRAST
jgi:hypothetical protein